MQMISFLKSVEEVVEVVKSMPLERTVKVPLKCLFVDWVAGSCLFFWRLLSSL